MFTQTHALKFFAICEWMFIICTTTTTTTTKKRVLLFSSWIKILLKFFMFSFSLFSHTHTHTHTHIYTVFWWNEKKFCIVCLMTLSLWLKLKFLQSLLYLFPYFAHASPLICLQFVPIEEISDLTLILLIEEKTNGRLNLFISLNTWDWQL